MNTIKKKKQPGPNCLVHSKKTGGWVTDNARRMRFDGDGLQAMIDAFGENVGARVEAAPPVRVAREWRVGENNIAHFVLVEDQRQIP